MWAILDVENFYVSAERLFDPALRKVAGNCLTLRVEAKAGSALAIGADAVIRRKKGQGRGCHGFPSKIRIARRATLS